MLNIYTLLPSHSAVILKQTAVAAFVSAIDGRHLLYANRLAQEAVCHKRVMKHIRTDGTGVSAPYKPLCLSA